jgi:acetyl esterase
MKELDSVIAEILSRVDGTGPYPGQTPEEMRALFSARIASEVQGGVRPSVEVVRMTVPTRSGELQARLYRPSLTRDGCGILFFHSGGFVIGDLDTGEPVALALARHTAWPVISVAYRLAPEHPFPAAVEDAIDSGSWIASRLDVFGTAADRFVVAGDSAGGTLAAVVAQELGPGLSTLAAQCLLYPALVAGDAEFDRNDDPFIDANAIQWFDSHYRASADMNDRRISPGLAHELERVPPAVFGVSKRDPLTAATARYSDALQNAGVTTYYHAFDELPHGFAEFDCVSNAAEAAMKTISIDLVHAAESQHRNQANSTGANTVATSEDTLDSVLP